MTQKLEIPIDILPGDTIDFVVDARQNHDCDGLYMVDFLILLHTGYSRDYLMKSSSVGRVSLSSTSDWRKDAGPDGQ